MDASWDEGINCSLYAADICASVSANLKVTGQNAKIPCPVDPKKCSELKNSVSKKYLSPICIEIGSLTESELSKFNGSVDYTFKQQNPVPSSKPTETGR